MFFINDIFKCSCPPPPIFFDQSVSITGHKVSKIQSQSLSIDVVGLTHFICLVFFTRGKPKLSTFRFLSAFNDKRESLEVHDDFCIGSALGICSWFIAVFGHCFDLRIKTLTLPPFLAEFSFRRKQETKKFWMKSEYTPTLYNLSNSQLPEPRFYGLPL